MKYIWNESRGGTGWTTQHNTTQDQDHEDLVLNWHQITDLWHWFKIRRKATLQMPNRWREFLFGKLKSQCSADNRYFEKSAVLLWCNKQISRESLQSNTNHEAIQGDSANLYPCLCHFQPRGPSSCRFCSTSYPIGCTALLKTVFGLKGRMISSDFSSKHSPRVKDKVTTSTLSEGQA